MKEQQFEYDVQKRARAGTAATLRAVISLYIIYLACGDCLWRVYMENLAS